VVLERQLPPTHDLDPFVIAQARLIRRFQPESRGTRVRRGVLRSLVVRLATVVALLTLLAPAVAQAAGEPSTENYQTKLDSIRPDVKGLAVTTEGGDRYLVVRNDTGKVVLVLGYDDEPYLRFLPNGEVQANASSPAKYLNAIRFGTADSVTIPPSALASTKVKWEKVAGNGTYKWFDHRIHWMEKDPPSVVTDESKRTKIFDWKVPAKVAGTPVTLVGTLSWVPTPSSSSGGISSGAIAALVGGALVLLAGVALLLRRRRPVAARPEREKAGKEAW
jgi:hypothetical protein